ncbi:MAG: repeat protein [Bacteroidetes bacterium]|jgi:WD40 repeat protein|nr:repeat protein [Bacteroidota bacterium]
MISVSKIASLSGHSGSVYGLSEGLSEDMVLSAGGDRFVAQWNIKECRPDSFSVKLPSVVYTSFFLEERSQLLVGTMEGALHVIDLASRKEVKYLQLKAGGIFAILYSSLHNLLFLGTAGGHLIALNAQDLSVVADLPVSKLKLRSLCMDAAQEMLYVSDGNGQLHLFTVQGLKHRHSFEANKLSCNIVVLHPEADLILTGGRDAHLNVFDSKSYHRIHSIPAHNYAIYDIKFLTGTPYLATASRDKTVKLWNANDMSFLLRLNAESFAAHVNSVNALWWNEANKRLVSAGDDRAIMIWQIV